MTVLITLLVLLFADDHAAKVDLHRVGTLRHGPIREASGIVRSRKHRDVFWVHNDSGNPPALFAVRRDGTLIREYVVNALNIDWEDVATDDHGHLYLGEIGNNDGLLPLRAIYQLDEPDPSKPAKGPLPVKAQWYYRFPRDGRFDAESLVIDGDQALIIAKSFDGRDAEIHAIPLKVAGSPLRAALPKMVGRLPGFTHPASGADLTADGLRLVVCATDRVGVFERKTKDAAWKAVTLRSFPANDQIEAVTWDGDDILLAGESRSLFRVPAAVWRETPKPGGRAR